MPIVPSVQIRFIGQPARLRRCLLAGPGCALLLLTLAPATSLAGPKDVTATQGYLRADYEYQLALQAVMPLVRSAATGFATQVNAECGGALRNVEANLQKEETPGMRALGENALHSEQLMLLGEELIAAGRATMFSPDQTAFQGLQSAVGALVWEDTALSTATAEVLQEEHTVFFSPPPAACQDIRAWIASGFHLLSPGTKAFLGERERQKEPPGQHRVAIDTTIQHLETSEGKALASKISLLRTRRQEELASSYEAIDKAQQSVGLKPEYSPQLRKQAHEIRNTTKLGSGSTAAKGRYTVNITKTSGRCSYKISVQDTGSTSPQTPMCAVAGHATVQRVRCEEGERIVEALMPGNVRKVLLRLSDRRSVNSHTVAVPAKLGGPASIYYQAVPRGSAVPISMTEFDAPGHTLATVSVHPADKCVRHQLHTVSGGSHKLASGQIPGGPRFTIIGDAFAYNGPSQLSLSVEVEGLGGGGSNLKGAHPKILELTTDDGCYPVDYHIVYGILRATDDTVQAHADGKVTNLQRVKVPASLRTDGTLVYGVFTGPLESIVVSTPTGRKADTESLEEWTKGQQEYCQGFIEPGRAPQDEGHLF